MKIFNLLQIQYNKFENSVRSYLSRMLSNFGEIYNNNTIFGQLINVVGNSIQNIILYIEDSLVEQNKYTAQRKKSIYGLASLSGYNPSYGKAAGVSVKLSYTLSNENYSPIILKNKTIITNSTNGLQYVLILPQDAITLSIDKDSSDKILYAVQGKFESASFVSTGGKYYTQNFRFIGNVDYDYIDVYINNEKWERVDSFYDMVPDGKQYVLKTSVINGVDIVFGNDMHGRSLNNEDIIKVDYLVHDGEHGNIESNKNPQFVFTDELVDIYGESIDGNSVFNIYPASGDSISSGTNSESIDQIRQMIGLNSRSLVLASPENYKNAISKFSFCGYNRTWSEEGRLIIKSMILKNFNKKINSGLDYFNLNENDFILSDSQKESIKNHLKNSGNMICGSTYTIVDPDLCKYSVYIYITLKKGKGDKVFIENKIRSLIGDLFSDVNNDKYIAKSDIIHLIKSNINDIDGVSLYFLSERNETAIITGTYKKTSYVYDISLGKYIKKDQNIKLYPGENPNIGLDDHGNILLNGDNEFPVLMGGWKFKSSTDNQLIHVFDPVVIKFE